MVSSLDKVSISIKAGDGGPGACSFRREKYVPKGGPDGGNGGDGGNVILKASERIQTLSDFFPNKIYKAFSGKSGAPKKQFGCNGKDIILEVPLGTLVYDEKHSLLIDLSKKNQTFIAAKGGRGGKGNSAFASSVNRTPRYTQSGIKGESKTIHLELRLIASIGLIGLPNAGKSTLLSTLTKASPKIGNYAFTTLFPNLGTLRFYNKEIIIADIPGLIEGSSKGLGLGHDFLRHIDRTKVLVHLVKVSEDYELNLKQFNIVRNELKKSDYSLISKQSIPVLSCCDAVSEEVVNDSVNYFKDNGIDILPISSFSNLGIRSLIDTIYSNYDT
jgi:GTP-binding protein